MAYNKCAYVFLGYKAEEISPSTYSLSMNNQIIFNTNQFRYSGVLGDCQMIWLPHINKAVDSARLGVNMIASLCKRSWGIHPSTALLFYKSIVRPQLDWSSFLFAGANKSSLRRLDTL